MKKYWAFNTILGISDLFSINLAFLLSYLIRFSIDLENELFPVEYYYQIIFFINVLLLVTFSIFKLYKQKRNLFDTDEFMNVVKAMVFTFFIVISTTYLYKTSISYSRFILLLTFILGIGLITSTRLIVKTMLGSMRRKGYNRQKAIIIGTNETGLKVINKINTHKEWGYTFLGFVGKKIEGQKHLGHLDEITKILKEKRPDVVFIALKNMQNDLLMTLILKYPHIEFKVVPPIIESLIKVPDYDEFKDMPLVVIPPSDINSYMVLKRVIDVVISLLSSFSAPFFMVLNLKSSNSSPSSPTLFCLNIGFPSSKSHR
jgi:FlaA1/EpsC-like NDP-sugar epimerase